MVKIVLDSDRCIGSGICETIAPAYFKTGEDGALTVMRGAVDSRDQNAVEEAVHMCPVRALSLKAKE